MRVDFKSATFDMGEPHKAVLKPIPPPPSAGVGWVPQLRADITLPEPTKRSKTAKKAWEQNLAKFMAPTVPEREPPPYYMARAAPAMPTMPPMPVKLPQQTLPPTPAATLKLSFDGIIPPPSQKPKPSRTSSYGPHPALAPRLSLSSRKSDRKFPRLMTVAHPFEPSMDDELSIGLGETVRLLEEYEDEWCLVQRVGRIDAMKGVVPRFCLMERAEVIPSHPRHPSAGSYRC
ncbi:hypothetical protein PILCRDRAFT_322820 [Piloderma croceum F 1598]|uniref:SH3 domain-containing protein n=1 Tax=Piloderma croceum (strain F 1598) TaxID=765440 RepID=A0A0C3G3A3_PILCF|nr:hypothetical protein PILCRDRAFT_322820 [Piloderma croceum F 1598]